MKDALMPIPLPEITSNRAFRYEKSTHCRLRSGSGLRHFGHVHRQFQPCIRAIQRPFWGGSVFDALQRNSSSTFVVLAGMGLALMTNRAAYTTAERQRIRRVVFKRSLFLFVLGLLLSLWWPPTSCTFTVPI
jgi:hypothetical protein